MGTYFLDSSAIVKRYVAEKGHAWIITLCDPVHGNEFYISQIALVEVVRAICIKALDKLITIADRDRLIDMFRRDSQSAYGVSLLTDPICTYGGDLCRSHRLRSYDAVQLASVLILRKETRLKHAPPPVFVSADLDLIKIATTEGLKIENPENYP
jgi:predicted nucleic acid-binding protein